MLALVLGVTSRGQMCTCIDIHTYIHVDVSLLSDEMLIAPQLLCFSEQSCMNRRPCRARADVTHDDLQPRG